VGELNAALYNHSGRQNRVDEEEKEDRSYKKKMHMDDESSKPSILSRIKKNN